MVDLKGRFPPMVDFCDILIFVSARFCIADVLLQVQKVHQALLSSINP